MSEFNPQELANMVWALAKADQSNKKLLAVLACTAERRVSEFNSQDLAATA